VIQPGSSSDNPNLTIYERSRPPRDRCILCDKPFDDVKLTRFCPTCDHRLNNSNRYGDVSSRPSTRLGSTNIYVPASDRSYTSLSPALKTRLSNKVLCPHCKMPNLILNLTLNTEYHCSACQNPIPTAYLN
jgi:rubredoxin